MKKIVFLTGIFLIGGLAFGQEQDESFDPNTLNDPEPNWPVVINPILENIKPDPEEMIIDTAHIIVEGFRVQVLSTRSSDIADSLRQVLQKKIDEDVYVKYEVPNYKVRVGDCVDRRQAEILQKKLKKLGYRSAWIIRTRVELQPSIKKY